MVLPKISISEDQLNYLTTLISLEIETIKSLISNLEDAIKAYNDENAVKIYKDLFESIKHLVKAEERLTIMKDSLTALEMDKKLNDLFTNFKKMVPRMPLYFTKNLEKDIKHTKEVLQKKTNQSQNYRILAGKRYFKYLEASIRDYNSFFILVDKLSDMETALARKFLRTKQETEAKKALIRKKRYQNAIIPFLWQKLNLEKILIVLSMQTALDLLQEAKKTGRIPPSNVGKVKIFLKTLDEKEKILINLYEKYSKNLDTVKKLDNYIKSYQNISERFKSILEL
jgi:hypothetical protein